MLPDNLSFVDVETTGCTASYNRIIEIGIVRVKKGRVAKEYQTLVNPQMYIDPFIHELTGITKEDLENAPTFEDIKEEVLDLLHDSVFVAHNVRFDYSFLRNEFRRFDINFHSKHFCTIKLARILYPEAKKYNLDHIIERFNIRCERRHRAFYDAKAIWDFYELSQIKSPKEDFIRAVNIALKRPSIPISISQEELDILPEDNGVYIFYGENRMPLYIGKSINIKDRVLSHFSNDHISPTDMKISQQVKDIKAIVTSSELEALLLESDLIKKHKPLFNKKLRNKRGLIVALKIKNNDNYNSLQYLDADSLNILDLENVLGIFKSNRQLESFLYSLCKEKYLCPKLLNFEKAKTSCFYYHLRQCKGACIKKESSLRYNLRLDEAFYKYKIKLWPFKGPIIIDNFLVDKWCILGKMDEIKERYSFDYDAYKIILKYLSFPQNLKRVVEIN